MLRQFIVTQADPQKIDSYWFYITEQGLTRMQKLGEEAKRT
jgi:phosphoribosyl-ATP pyrophosphohydrolase